MTTNQRCVADAGGSARVSLGSARRRNVWLRSKLLQFKVFRWWIYYLLIVFIDSLPLALLLLALSVSVSLALASTCIMPRSILAKLRVIDTFTVVCL